MTVRARSARIYTEETRLRIVAFYCQTKPVIRMREMGAGMSDVPSESRPAADWLAAQQIDTETSTERGIRESEGRTGARAHNDALSDICFFRICCLWCAHVAL